MKIDKHPTDIQYMSGLRQETWVRSLAREDPLVWGASSAHGKGHEEGGLTYAKAGSSLRSPPGCSRTSPPQKKTGVCLLYCFMLSPVISLGAVPHHHLALSVKELTYSSNS